MHNGLAALLSLKKKEIRAHFEHGELVLTPCAVRLVREGAFKIQPLLSRHLACDWGCVAEEVKAANELVVAGLIPGRILSAYYESGVRVWVMTEADQKSTTFLLPSEY